MRKRTIPNWAQKAGEGEDQGRNDGVRVGVGLAGGR